MTTTEPTTEPLVAAKAPLRPALRAELAAEAFGTAIMIAVGVGSVAASQRSASGDASAQRLYINFSWGAGVALGVLASFDVSGAHLNPAVTLHAAAHGGFPPRKVVPYVLAQLLGAMLGALVASVDYAAFPGRPSLANFFCTAPADGVSWANAIYDEVAGTVLLLVAIRSVTAEPVALSRFVVAGWVGLAVFGVGCSFGALSGFAINPARDLGPRLVYLLFAALDRQDDLWGSVMGHGYFLVPLLAPLAAALSTALVGVALSAAQRPRRRGRGDLGELCAVATQS